MEQERKAMRAGHFYSTRIIVAAALFAAVAVVPVPG
jgi:hypothetical protein